MNSLWGKEFEIKSNKDATKKALEKIANVKQVKTKSVDTLLKSKKVSIEDKLDTINKEVNRVLGVYKPNTICIYTRDKLHEYINHAIKNGIIAIDTETNNSLDPFTCLIMGGCIYTPGEKNAYIPINHTDLSGNRLINQCTEKDLFEEFSRLNNTKILFHNATFDYEVVYCTCGIKLSIFWDTMIGAKMLDENEPARLKWQYINKIDSSIEKYSIDKLFSNVEYKYVDPEIFALYSATDAFMTYKLYLYQLNEFTKVGCERLYDVFINVEMPVVTVCAEMELSGICLDLPYCERLQKKYHSLLDNVDKKIDSELSNLKIKIDNWRTSPEANKKQLTQSGKLGKSKNEQLSDPPDVNSPTQLAILLYDILGADAVNSKKPRSTAKEDIEKIDLNITKYLTERKDLYKLISSFIDTLPTQINPQTGKLHAHFNQLGSEDNNVVTGRFSCTNPNLQQIPSKNKEIRLMFKASDGYMLVGSDYSAQEPRLLTAYSKEPALIDAFDKDRDVYATLGAGVFKNDYWDNMEHTPDGKDNVEGKKRRKKMKTLLLGMMYGMGPGKLSKSMKVSMEEANKIIDDFHKGFPKATEWINITEENAKKIGYVEDFWGRRRRLPDVFLPEYEFENESSNFNPLFNTSGKFIDDSIYSKYMALLNSSKSKKETDKIKSDAKKEGIVIHSNGGYISKALRQSVNARIQGGAATMTKKAMIAIYNDEEMKRYDFKLLIGVHDELIGECKKEYAEKCAERLTYLMKTCVPEIGVTLKCDPTIEINWAEEDYSANLKKEYKDMNNNFELLCSVHSENTPELIMKYINK